MSVICDQIGRWRLRVNRAAGLVVIEGAHHSAQHDRDGLVRCIRFLTREAARPRFGLFYHTTLAAHRRALEILEGDGA